MLLICYNCYVGVNDMIWFIYWLNIITNCFVITENPTYEKRRLFVAIDASTIIGRCSRCDMHHHAGYYAIDHQRIGMFPFIVCAPQSSSVDPCMTMLVAIVLSGVCIHYSHIMMCVVHHTMLPTITVPSLSMASVPCFNPVNTVNRSNQRLLARVLLLGVNEWFDNMYVL